MQEPVKYLTDDRDGRERNALWILQGGNGDWYVGVAPEGEYPVGKMVRLCTSGGASSRCPGLTTAICNAYKAISSNDQAHAPPRTTNDMKNTTDSQTATAPAVVCSDLLAALREYEEKQRALTSIPRLLLYSDGSGRLENMHGELFSFHNTAQALELLKAANDRALRPAE